MRHENRRALDRHLSESGFYDVGLASFGDLCLETGIFRRPVCYDVKTPVCRHRLWARERRLSRAVSDLELKIFYVVILVTSILLHAGAACSVQPTKM